MKKKVLLIDDDDELAELLSEYLNRFDFQLIVAGNGEEGLKLLRQEQPDCVLLDIRIPKGEDGLTYLRKLRSYRHDDPEEQTRIRRTPVIMLTGAGAAMQSLFELEGISGFVEKPFDLVNLQSKVAHILQIR